MRPWLAPSQAQPRPLARLVVGVATLILRHKCDTRLHGLYDDGRRKGEDHDAKKNVENGHPWPQSDGPTAQQIQIIE